MKMNERITDDAIIPEKKRMLAGRDFPKGRGEAKPKDESESQRREPFARAAWNCPKAAVAIGGLELGIKNHLLRSGTQQVDTPTRRRTLNVYSVVMPTEGIGKPGPQLKIRGLSRSDVSAVDQNQFPL